MLRASHGHVEQPKLILVRHRAAVDTAQVEIVRHLDPLPFEPLGTVYGVRSHSLRRLLAGRGAKACR
ncbi:hypothetical protein LMG28727_07705 [Paraburkholderia kirstenboschensis]|nr:hypothetical protein LMG28727_07705 [Paraburkholderia kirstenboschensis]